MREQLDSAAAGIEPAISSRKSNALTTTPPSRQEEETISVHVLK